MRLLASFPFLGSASCGFLVGFLNGRRRSWKENEWQMHLGNFDCEQQIRWFLLKINLRVLGSKGLDPLLITWPWEFSISKAPFLPSYSPMACQLQTSITVVLLLQPLTVLFTLTCCPGIAWKHLQTAEPWTPNLGTSGVIETTGLLNISW